MNKTWTVLIIALLGIMGVPLNAQRSYTKTTVCRVLRLGTANRPRYVKISANVMADHMHSALLIDPKCPSKGILLGVSPDDADQSVTEFDHVLWSDGPPGFSGRMVSGTFFGRLKVGRNLPLNPGHKKLNIALIRVENLSDTRPHENR